jgi:hypothetical protein
MSSIGGREAMLGSMQDIAQQLLLNAANHPCKSLIYSSAEQGDFGFGIRRDGLFGQVG